MKEYPSQARLRELFDYDPDGFLVWRETLSRRNKKGNPAGSRGFNKELRYVYDIGINGEIYKGVRLIWIWHKGENPDGKVYTKNGIYSDTRIENLTLRQGAPKTNYLKKRGGSEYIGVYKRGDSWRCEFKGNDLGHFSTQEAAARAYDIEGEKIFGENGFTSNGVDKTIDIEKYRVTLKGNKRLLKTARGTQSKYIGVSKHITKKKGVRFSVKFRKKHMGIFETEQQAARAYNIAAYEHYGENAVLNDIPDPLGKGDAF